MTLILKNRRIIVPLRIIIFTAFLLSLLALNVQAAEESPTVSVSSNGANMIKVSWTSVSGAAKYNIYRCSKASPYQKIASTSDTSYVDYSVENDTPYEYSVTAVVNGKETEFRNKGALGYTAYQEAHVYQWQVTDLTPWSFTVSGKVSYAGTASVLHLPVWTEENGQDDIQWYTVPVSGKSFSYTIYASNHGNQRGVYVLDPYLNDSLLYCKAPLWVEVPKGTIRITSPGIVGLSEEGFTSTAIVTAFNNKVKSVKAEIWTAFHGEDDLETVNASYDSATGVVSCPVRIQSHNNEASLYYVRFTVTDGEDKTKSLVLRTFVPTSQKCMSFTVIDLGEGNIAGSASLLTSRGQGLLIDSGRSDSASAVVNALRQHGLTSVDIIITHGDGDHIGVAQAILDAGISIGTVYTDQYPTDLMWDELDRRSSISVFKKNAKIKAIPATLTIGDATLTTIGPVKHYSLYDAAFGGASQANLNSYWFMITNGSRKILVNGDSEILSSKDMLDSGADLHADIYILGHHGATNSLNKEILNAISPEKAVASGRITSEITADTIQKLKDAGIPYYYTSKYGSIDFSFRGKQYSMNTERNSDTTNVYYQVEWRNADGKTLEKDSLVKQGNMPSYDRALPTLKATAQYTYTFAGWSTDGKKILTSLPKVTKDVVYIAVYQKTVNEYRITWQDEDGTVLETAEVPYGQSPSYHGATPTKAATKEYTYTFAGWSKDGKKVLSTIPKTTGAAVYIAIYKATVRTYKITWKNVDGSILKTSKVAYGSVPAYENVPKYPANDGVVYTFDGWVPGLHAVTGAATYTAAFTASSPKIKRLWGVTRYETASEILREAFEDDSQDRIILTSGSSFQYAILGTTLSGAMECPLLITAQERLSEATRAEIQRLSAEGCEIVILGDASVVSEGIEAELLEIEKISEVKRVTEDAGSYRKLALQVYKKAAAKGLWTETGTVIIANGESFADSVSIAPYAYAAKTPILFTLASGDLTSKTLEALSKYSAKRAILIGGTGAVSQKTENQLAEAGIICVRLAGEDRYRSSQKVFKWVTGEDTGAAFGPETVFSIENVGFATGQNDADAIASANLLGKQKNPVLLVSEKDAAVRILFEVMEGREDQVVTAYIFGGTGAVSEHLACRIADAVTKNLE